MLKQSLVTGKAVPFPLYEKWEENLLDIIVVLTMLVTLIATFVYGAMNKA